MNYAQIRNMDISDGPGIRIALYVSGCNHHCFNCYSKEQWDYNYGEIYTKETEKMILNKLKSSHISGLSLLGGDPLWQSGHDIECSLIPLVQQAKALNKSVWIWSGFTWDEIMNPGYKIYDNETHLMAQRQKLIKLCDVWVDGRYEDDKRDLRLSYCGSTNQRVIDVQATLQNPSKKVVLWSPKS